MNRGGRSRLWLLVGLVGLCLGSVVGYAHAQSSASQGSASQGSASQGSASQGSASQGSAPDGRYALDGSGFTDEERIRLAQGESVKRKFHLEMDDVLYRAGLSYRLVRASPLDVVSALRSPQGIARSIPYGIEATTLEERDGVSKVRILQGKPPIVGGYTVRLSWEVNQYRARFWLDPNDEHDVKDIWGSIVAREVAPGVTLICFAIAFDLGGVGEILGSKAHRWSLSTADRLGDLVEERTGRSLREPQSSSPARVED